LLTLSWLLVDHGHTTRALAFTLDHIEDLNVMSIGRSFKNLRLVQVEAFGNHLLSRLRRARPLSSLLRWPKQFAILLLGEVIERLVRFLHFDVVGRLDELGELLRELGHLLVVGLSLVLG
jgi:broad specificity phosphatase PhoE